jgi:MFS family permease
MQNAAVTALNAGYDFSLLAAGRAVSLYLLGGGCGMVLGGFLAERTREHHRVAMSGIAVAALVMAAIAWSSALSPPALVGLLALAGLANGITGPSRDVLVRRAAAGIGVGSVFGFVYSGFDLGSSTAPLLFGLLLDQGAPHAVFLAIACSFALGVPTVMQVSQRILARAERPAAAE